MSKDVKAVSEEMILLIRDDDLVAIETTMAAKPDLIFWRSVLRHEHKVANLMDTILQTDIMLPKMLICGFETISAFHLTALRGADIILQFYVDSMKVPAEMALSSSGTLALHLACFSGQLQVVKMLVQKYKVDVEKRDSYGWSALHYASCGGYLEVVKFLIEEAKAAVDARDQDGTTAAFRAENFGHMNIVSYFVQNQIDGDLLLLCRPDLGQPIKTPEIYSLANKNNPYIKEEYISKIKCTYNSEDADNPYLIDIKQKSSSSQSKTGASNTDQSALTRSSADQLGEAAMKREASKRLLQQIIGDELESVMTDDPYLRPDTKKLESATIEDLGVGTIKHILRQAFLKHRDQASELQTSPIYESIRSPSHNPWTRGGDTLRRQKDQRSPSNAPALPPMRKSAVTNDNDALKLFTPNDKQTALEKAAIVLDAMEMDRVILDAVFQELGEMLAGKMVGGESAWKKLAAELPLRRKTSSMLSRVNTIERAFETERRQTEAMLLDWRQHFGIAADIETLAAALNRCGLVEEIRNISDTKDKLNNRISII